MGQCHAPYSSLSWACTCPPLAGSILGAPCPSTAPLAGVLTLQQCCDTLVFHQALPSAFFLPSAQPQGFPDETEVRGALRSSCRDDPLPCHSKKNTLSVFIIEPLFSELSLLTCHCISLGLQVIYSHCNRCLICMSLIYIHEL